MLSKMIRKGMVLKKLPSCLPRAAARERRLSAPCYHTLLWHDTFSTIPSIFCGTDTSTLCSTVRVRVCGTIFTHSSNSFKFLRQRIRLRAVMRRSCQDHGDRLLFVPTSSTRSSLPRAAGAGCAAPTSVEVVIVEPVLQLGRILAMSNESLSLSLLWCVVCGVRLQSWLLLLLLPPSWSWSWSWPL